MNRRGDLLQLLVSLFRERDPQRRRQLAERIGEMARDAADQPLPASPDSSSGGEGLEGVMTPGAPLMELSDAHLDALNTLLPWGAMTGDGRGRVVGSAWSDRKRSRVQPLIDRRISDLNEAFPLSGRHVLEVGCFEGIHTIGCLAQGARVTAVDVRMENVLKTMARLWAYGLHADVKVWDLEAEPPPSIPSRWDFLLHIGVLYHLTNPAEQLASALDRTEAGVLLDTHVAEDIADADASYSALERSFAYSRKDEVPISPFAGVRDHAKWLLAEDLEWICRDRGFTDVSVRQVRRESNGRRVLIWAFRPGQRPISVS